MAVAGASDPVLAFSPWQGTERWLADLRSVTIVEGPGRWVQQERPCEVDAALLGFPGGLDLT